MRKYSNKIKDSIVQVFKDGSNAREFSDEYGPIYQTIRRHVLDDDDF